MNPQAEQDIASASFQLQRVGVMMEPEPGNPMAGGGMLNPASAKLSHGVSRLRAREVVVNYRGHPKEAKKIVAEIKTAGGQASLMAAWRCIPVFTIMPNLRPFDLRLVNYNSIAFGEPGIEPRLTSSAKDCISTAYHSASHPRPHPQTKS